MYIENVNQHISPITKIEHSSVGGDEV